MLPVSRREARRNSYNDKGIILKYNNPGPAAFSSAASSYEFPFQQNSLVKPLNHPCKFNLSARRSVARGITGCFVVTAYNGSTLNYLFGML